MVAPSQGNPSRAGMLAVGMGMHCAAPCRRRRGCHAAMAAGPARPMANAGGGVGGQQLKGCTVTIHQLRCRVVPASKRTGVPIGFTEAQAASLMSVARTLPVEKRGVFLDRVEAYLRLQGSWPWGGVPDETFQQALQV